MNDLKEYSNSTSGHELFSFFYERIFSGEISTFSSLKKLAAPALCCKQSHQILNQAFDLIKRLYWGFFSGITPLTHGKLWREIVIADNDFRDMGDLKRTLQISDLYIAILDIHGYTKFCMDTRKNLSMMHILDRAMENEVGGISASCGAISHRERGDEMIVVAASASDILTATLSIIDYFSKTNIVRDPKIITKREGDTAALPEFKISAGITGGNTTSPLIITNKGGLSGFLLNSGARLQTRANELSPKESKIMIARQVQMNFEKENTLTQCSLAKNKALYFFDTGHIVFKGVTIPTCEVIYKGEERYKQEFVAEMSSLMESTRENLWEQRIFGDLVQLIVKAAQRMPPFSIPLPCPIEGIPAITNESLAILGKKAMISYFRDENYAGAIHTLRVFADILEAIPAFDRLILDYLNGIHAKYAMLLDSYNVNIDQQVHANAAEIFPGNNYNTWIAAQKGAFMYEKLSEAGRKSPLLKKKKTLWYSLIRQKQNDMVFTLYSGKK